MRFTIPGSAVPQGRPRLTTRGGHPHAYDPQRSRDFKRTVRILVQAAMRDAGHVALPGAVELYLCEFRAIPKSWSKSKREKALCGELMPTTKPDTSNVTKPIEDALNEVAWGDDSQIVASHSYKVYSDNPRVEIAILEVKKACVPDLFLS